jgi:O-antigen ligase
MVADHPIFGVGLDNFLYQYRTRYMLPEAWEEPNISHPHNWVLHFWLQLGLPGLLVVLASIGWIALAAHRRFHQPRAPADRPLAATSIGLLVVFLVHGSIDNSYFLIDLATVWWLTLALLAISNPASRIDSSNHRSGGVSSEP